MKDEKTRKIQREKKLNTLEIKVNYIQLEIDNTLDLLNRGLKILKEEDYNDSTSCFTSVRILSDGLERFFRIVITICNWEDWEKSKKVINRTHNIKKLINLSLTELESRVYKDELIIKNIKEQLHNNGVIQETIKILTDFSIKERYCYYDVIFDEKQITEEKAYEGIIGQTKVQTLKMEDLLEKWKELTIANKEQVIDNLIELLNSFGKSLAYKIGLTKAKILSCKISDMEEIGIRLKQHPLCPVDISPFQGATERQKSILRQKKVSPLEKGEI
jgi:hypothetical protein